MILSTMILNFNIRLVYLVDYFEENTERFGFTELEMELFASLWEEWKQTYRDYTNPLTHSDRFAQDINDLHDRFYKLVSSMKIRVANSGVELTAVDRAFLEINTNKKVRGKVPVTDYAPSLVLLENGNLVMRFFAMDPKHMGTKRKPGGAAYVGILLAYTEQGAPPPAPEDYKKLNAEKKTIFEVIVPADKAELVRYVKVYYISPTREEGKVSLPVIVNVLK